MNRYPFLFAPAAAWQFLLESVRFQPESGRLLSIVEASPDWDVLYGACLQHGVFPLVQQSLSCLPDGVISVEERERFRSAAASCMLRSLAMRNELQRLLGLITASGISVIPFKGAVLAEGAYGDVALRVFDDLDLLVPPQEIHRVVALLETNGYQLAVDRQVLERPEFLTLTQHVCLNHASKPWMVEVHKALFPDWRRIPLQFADVWQGDGNCSAGQAGTMGDEDTLLILCIHGTLHQWNKIKWVVDVDRWVRSAPALDWNQFNAKADSLGCRTAVSLGLHLAQRFCDTPITQEFRGEFDRDKALFALESYVVENWFEPEKHEGSFWHRWSFNLLARERFADRWQMICANLRVRFYRHLMRMPV